jgi:hypothetical protein
MLALVFSTVSARLTLDCARTYCRTTTLSARCEAPNSDTAHGPLRSAAGFLTESG